MKYLYDSLSEQDGIVMGFFNSSHILSKKFLIITR